MTTPNEHSEHAKTPSTAGTRYHGFDALRGAAMSLGVVLHAAVAYMVFPIPGLAWPVHDDASSRVIDWLFWWIHGFRIPLFFVVAGFFSVMLFNSRGGKKYIDHRTRRILLPLLIACLVILPAVFAVWCYGWIDSGNYTWHQIKHRDFGGAETFDSVTGLAHLWFLEYLYIYCVLFWLWRVVMNRLNPPWRRSDRLNRLARGLFAHPLRPLIFAVPTFLVLAYDIHVITYFRNEYIPPLPELMYHFCFFVFGAWMYVLCRSLDPLKRFGRSYLVLSLVAGVFMVMGIENHLHNATAESRDLGLAALVAVYCWLSIFGWIGVALRWFDSPRPAVRWLSDSAYWVYLMHLPLVGLMHIWLTHLAGPAIVKFIATTLTAYAACLITYQLFVRHTRIGTLLNGRRERSSRKTAPRLPAKPAQPATGID